MNAKSCSLILVLLFLKVFVSWSLQPDTPLWKPQADKVFLQEVSAKVITDKPVTSVAIDGKTTYALVQGEIFRIEKEKLVKESGSPGSVSRLLSKGGMLWALADDGIYHKAQRRWNRVAGDRFVDVCVHLGRIYAATREEIFIFENGKFVSLKPEGGYYSTDLTMTLEDGTQLHATPVRIGPIERIESYSSTLYVLRPGNLAHFDGKVVATGFIDWGNFPSSNTRDMVGMGSRLFIATDRGLGVLRGASLFLLKGEDGLPVENATCLEKGFDGDLWIGTERGAVRMVDGDWHYFGADHWLPDNRVNDIAVGENVVYIATDGGIGIISYEPYTLLKKADYFERHIEEWGHMRLGFIHSIYKRDGEWIRHVSDNDGSITSQYLVALCYKYAVTGDEATRQKALESFRALVWLNKITQHQGFIARSIWSTSHDKDPRSISGSGGLPAKWYPTPDGKWYWKGDTSSDEVIGHFYAVTLFHDLVARGREKEAAQEHIRLMSDYIIDCGWTMHDLDGKPTRWARWNPEYLLRPYGYSDRGLNGLEALAFMEAAMAISGENRFREGYQQLLDWGYAENTVRQKNTFPPNTVAPWDDNLAFKSYNVLLRYAKDPGLRSIYIRSLERSWEIKRMEQMPWFNFTYGSLTGNDCELDRAVSFLREWPLDCIQHNFNNSHRDDLFVEKGYRSYEGASKRLTLRETSALRAYRRPNQLDGGSSGNSIVEPSGFLRDYWMGRYFGMIEPPATNDPALVSVPRRKGIKLGAEPYNGPPRPDFGF
jgi:hypothetical protein